MRMAWVSVVLAACAAQENIDCDAMRIKELRIFLQDRGLRCDGCAEKADFVAMCHGNKDAPIKREPEQQSQDASNEPKDEKNIEDLLASLKGMPGMEGIKMFTVRLS